ncbi:MAG: hypothetical protein HKN92_02245 [Chitinophagales bacterium]|nr:hypothetical protein [Chitinophagales bacterium]
MKWYAVRRLVRDRFGKRPDLNAILYLIGINELGMIKDSFEKEEKEDLMHIAICRLFSQDGYFEYQGRDDEGWPHYTTIKPFPKSNLKEQEELIKKRVVQYFEDERLIGE